MPSHLVVLTVRGSIALILLMKELRQKSLRRWQSQIDIDTVPRPLLCTATSAGAWRVCLGSALTRRRAG